MYWLRWAFNLIMISTQKMPPPVHLIFLSDTLITFVGRLLSDALIVFVGWFFILWDDFRWIVGWSTQTAEAADHYGVGGSDERCRHRIRWWHELPFTGRPALANMRRWPNVVSMLIHRLRRWPNIETTLGQCLLFCWVIAAVVLNSVVTKWPVWKIAEKHNIHQKTQTIYTS